MTDPNTPDTTTARTGWQGIRPRVCGGPLTTAQARALHASHDPDRGLLVLSAPTAPQPSTLSSAVLNALGATGSLRLVGRVADTTLEVVLPWLLAYRVRHLLLTRADRMPSASLQHALELAAAAGITVWTTGAPLHDLHRQVLAGRRAQTLTAEEFLTAWNTATAQAQPVEPDETGLTARPAAWPPMPADDFPTFRAAMRRCLPADVFAAADALFLATMTDARARLAPLLCGDNDAVRAVEQDRPGVVCLDRTALEKQVSRYLHTLIGASTSTPEVTVRLRAAQVAAFRLGWLLSVNLDRVVATADEPSVAARRDPRTWQALRLFRYPYQGAICVLAGLDLDNNTIRALPAGAVAGDGSTVTVHGHRFPVPPPARVMLRAQRLSGQLAGRTDAQPFIHVAGAPATRERVRTTVRAALLDAGVPLLSRKVDETWAGNDWLNRWGIALQEVS